MCEIFVSPPPLPSDNERATEMRSTLPEVRRKIHSSLLDFPEKVVESTSVDSSAFCALQSRVTSYECVCKATQMGSPRDPPQLTSSPRPSNHSMTIYKDRLPLYIYIYINNWAQVVCSFTFSLSMHAQLNPSLERPLKGCRPSLTDPPSLQRGRTEGKRLSARQNGYKSHDGDLGRVLQGPFLYFSR